MPSISIFLMLAAGTVAFIALVTDLRARRIPNWLTAGGVVVGICANVLLRSASDGAPGALSGSLFAVAGAALGFGLLFPFYMIRVGGLGRAIGAGDVKLLAALGAILGPQVVIAVVIYSALAGALQSIVILANQRRLTLLLHQTLVMHSAPTLGAGKAPYAVPIAIGVCLAMVLPPLVRF
jgi:prepilin peptidase CpaA